MGRIFSSAGAGHRLGQEAEMYREPVSHKTVLLVFLVTSLEPFRFSLSVGKTQVSSIVLA